MPLNVIIFGAPASGKGTVSAVIKDKYDVAHISTGDLLRAKKNEDSDEARELAEIMKSGSLVPDSVVIGLVKDTTNKDATCITNGYLLDGFPRSVAQAEAMFAEDAPEATKLVSPDVVVVLDVPFEVLKERIVYRRIDPETNAVYNIKKDEIPDEIKERLIQREDDTEEALQRRVQIFEDSTKNILAVLEKNPNTAIIRIDATQPADAVRTEALQRIELVIAGGKQTAAVDGKKGGACCVIM